MNASVLHIWSVIEALPWLACCSAGAVPGQGGGRTVTHCIFLALCYNSRNQRLLHLPLCNRCMATSPHPDPGQPRDQLTGRARVHARRTSASGRSEPFIALPECPGFVALATAPFLHRFKTLRTTFFTFPPPAGK